LELASLDGALTTASAAVASATPRRVRLRLVRAHVVGLPVISRSLPSLIVAGATCKHTLAQVSTCRCALLANAVQGASMPPPSLSDVRSCVSSATGKWPRGESPRTSTSSGERRRADARSQHL